MAVATSYLQPPAAAQHRAQNAKVAFRLKTGSQTVAYLVLPIKPSQLQLMQVSRVQTTQTFGGVYYDDFGFAVPTIQLAGTTGWFASPEGYFQSPGVLQSPLDGPTAYERLYDDIYLKYFQLEAASTGENPNVWLQLHATYENLNYYVKPVQNFTLTRDRSNPMVFQYTVAFSVVQDLTAGTVVPFNPAAATGAHRLVTPVVSTPPSEAEVVLRQASKVARKAAPLTPDPSGSKTVYKYTVQSGDILSALVLRFYGVVNSELISEVMTYSNETRAKYHVQTNKIINPNAIWPGQIIFFPAHLGKESLRTSLLHRGA